MDECLFVPNDYDVIDWYCEVHKETIYIHALYQNSLNGFKFEQVEELIKAHRVDHGQ